jgi:choline kinase
MPLTRNTPKSLLDLGDGYTLLEHQLRSIADAGIHDVSLVTGYRSEQIEAKIQAYSEFRFTIVYNPVYRMANNIVSAWMGLKDLSEPVILVNGDDLFQPSVVANLIQSPHEITMVIDRKPVYDDDDMKVVIEDDRIVDVGKELPAGTANGESIGMMLFRGRGLSDTQASLLAMMRQEENLQLFYLEALRRLMREGHPIHYSECGPNDWAEVDFHPDLDHMRQQLQMKKEMG